MLRNLLYSLFFHILFITLLALSTIELSQKILTTNITPLTISFLNENTIEDLEAIKTDNENDKIKNLSLEEKIELYNKLKNLKNVEENTKIIYEKSEKKPIVKQTNNNLNNIEENEFSYYYTPVYVAESKVNTEEKRKLIENRIRREELRKKMDEKNIAPKVDVSTMKQTQKMEDIIKISQKPLIVKKKEENKPIVVEDKTSVAVANNQQQTPQTNEEQNKENIEDIDGLISQINMSNNEVDEKYKDVNTSEIFNQEDYEKLKEIDENKIDSKYILSLREKINIQRQIKGCYKMAILRNKKDSKAIVGLTVEVAQDGIIDMHNIKINKIVDNFDNEGFTIALDNAKSALVFCSPLRGLPSGKYKTWKHMIFIFDSNNLE
ncbi:MAG: hypothetical protein PHY80_02950 [Rickettsiales bacterium]|nr:hypothetical protein [Rickettsiales bacterium]